MYLAQLGTFLQRDPVAEEGEPLLGYTDEAVITTIASRVAPPDTPINLYRYASNSPLDRVDPLGLKDEATPVSDFIEFLKNMKTVKDWIDAFKKNKKLNHIDALKQRFSLSGIAQEQVEGYIKALEQFSPDSNCGKWYKAAYLAILRAGTECDQKYCGAILVEDIKRKPATDCYNDLLRSGAGASVALTFRKLSNDLHGECAKLPRTSKNCVKEC